MTREVDTAGQLIKTTKTKIPKKLFWALFGFFIITRLIIIFCYQQHLSDINLYYLWASNGIVFGQTAYTTFSVPYPPLALPLFYVPMELSPWPYKYFHFAFHIEMFLIECVVFYFLIQYAFQMLKFNAWRLASVAAIYSILGLILGQCLYDRIDVIVALFFMLMIFSYSYWKNNWFIQYLLGTIGALTKIVPGLILIATAVMRSCDKDKISVKNTLREIANATGFIIIFLACYNIFTHGALLTDMFEHGKRGIQVESVWATPLLLKQVLSQDTSIKIVSNYSAQHLADSSVPATYFTLSKYFGFIVFGGMMIWLWTCLARTKANKNFPPQLFLLTCLTIILTFLGTQRVLSGQFFIWLMPSVSLWCVSRPNWGIAAAFLALYVLTCYVFLDYLEFINFVPRMIYASAVRNGILVALCAYFLWIWGASLRFHFPGKGGEIV